MDEPVSTVTHANRCKAVYTIVSRSPEKRIWVRVGTAWVNSDQSLNVKLDASPTNGELHIRDAEAGASRRSALFRRDAEPGELAMEAAS